MEIVSGSAVELADFTSFAVQDIRPLRIDGPARNEVTLERQNGINSKLGGFLLVITKGEREYKKNGPTRRLLRDFFGERGWTDTRISYIDAVNSEQTRRFAVQSGNDSCYVVIGDNRDPKATVRIPEASDVAILNQAVAFITYEGPENE